MTPLTRRPLIALRADGIEIPGCISQVLRHRPSGYVSASVDSDGFARSEVLGNKVRLVRRCQAAQLIFFQLEVEDAG